MALKGRPGYGVRAEGRRRMKKSPRHLSGRVVGEECLVAVEHLERQSAACLRRYSLSVVR
jgi:hypothetical protein